MNRFESNNFCTIIHWKQIKSSVEKKVKTFCWNDGYRGIPCLKSFIDHSS